MLISEYTTRTAVLGCSGHRVPSEESLALALVSWYGPLTLRTRKMGNPAWAKGGKTGTD